MAKNKNKQKERMKTKKEECKLDQQHEQHIFLLYLLVYEIKCDGGISYLNNLVCGDSSSTSTNNNTTTKQNKIVIRRELKRLSLSLNKFLRLYQPGIFLVYDEEEGHDKRLIVRLNDTFIKDDVQQQHESGLFIENVEQNQSSNMMDLLKEKLIQYFSTGTTDETNDKNNIKASSCCSSSFGCNNNLKEKLEEQIKKNNVCHNIKQHELLELASTQQLLQRIIYILNQRNEKMNRRQRKRRESNNESCDRHKDNAIVEIEWLMQKVQFDLYEYVRLLPNKKRPQNVLVGTKKWYEAVKPLFVEFLKNDTNNSKNNSPELSFKLSNNDSHIEMIVKATESQHPNIILNNDDFQEDDIDKSNPDDKRIMEIHQKLTSIFFKKQHNMTNFVNGIEYGTLLHRYPDLKSLLNGQDLIYLISSTTSDESTTHSLLKKDFHVFSSHNNEWRISSNVHNIQQTKEQQKQDRNGDDDDKNLAGVGVSGLSSSASSTTAKDYEIKNNNNNIHRNLLSSGNQDDVGLYSITNAKVAMSMAKTLHYHCRNYIIEKQQQLTNNNNNNNNTGHLPPTKINTIINCIDFTAGNGGNTIALSAVFNHVYAFEIDSDRVEILKLNLRNKIIHDNNNYVSKWNSECYNNDNKIKGGENQTTDNNIQTRSTTIGNVSVYNENSLDALPKFQDQKWFNTANDNEEEFMIHAAILDPPWGGLDYKKKKNKASSSTNCNDVETTDDSVKLKSTIKLGLFKDKKRNGRHDDHEETISELEIIIPLPQVVVSIGTHLKKPVVLGLKLPLTFDVNEFKSRLMDEQTKTKSAHNMSSSSSISFQVISIKKYHRVLFVILLIT